MAPYESEMFIRGISSGDEGDPMDEGLDLVYDLHLRLLPLSPEESTTTSVSSLDSDDGDWNHPHSPLYPPPGMPEPLDSPPDTPEPLDSPPDTPKPLDLTPGTPERLDLPPGTPELLDLTPKTLELLDSLPTMPEPLDSPLGSHEHENLNDDLYENFVVYVATGRLNTEEVQAQNIAASEDLQAIHIPGYHVAEEESEPPAIHTEAAAESKELEETTTPACNELADDLTQEVATSNVLRKNDSPALPNKLLDEILENEFKFPGANHPDQVQTQNETATSEHLEEVNTPKWLLVEYSYASPGSATPGYPVNALDDVYNCPGYPNPGKVQDQKKSLSNDLEEIYTSGYPDAEDVYETPEYMDPGSLTVEKVKAQKVVSFEKPEEIYQSVNLVTDDVYQSFTGFVHPDSLTPQQIRDQHKAALEDLKEINASGRIGFEEVYECPKGIHPGCRGPEKIKDPKLLSSKDINENNVEEIFENFPDSLSPEEVYEQKKAFTKVLTDVLSSRFDCYFDIHESPGNLTPPGWMESPDETDAQLRAAFQDRKEIKLASERMSERKPADNSKVLISKRQMADMRPYEISTNRNQDVPLQMKQQPAKDGGGSSRIRCMGVTASIPSDVLPNIRSRRMKLWNRGEFKEFERPWLNSSTAAPLESNVPPDRPPSRRATERFLPYRRPEEQQ